MHHSDWDVIIQAHALISQLLYGARNTHTHASFFLILVSFSYLLEVSCPFRAPSSARKAGCLAAPMSRPNPPMQVSSQPATAPFLRKAWEIVEDPETDAIVSWGPSGASFVVHDVETFSREILPRSFKHNNFSSFVRQLNTYVSFLRWFLAWLHLADLVPAIVLAADAFVSACCAGLPQVRPGQVGVYE